MMSADEEKAEAYRRAVEAGIIVPVNNWWLSSTLEGAADRATAVEASGPEAVGRGGAREVLLAACDAVKERNAARQERDDWLTGDSFKDLYFALQGQLIQLRQELQETKCQESVFTYQQVVRSWLEKHA